jgi:hypothetical protein
MNFAPKVSAVIAASGILAETPDSVLGQEFQSIVVDNSSTGKSKGALRS